MYKLIISKYGLVFRTITGKEQTTQRLVKSLVYSLPTSVKQAGKVLYGLRTIVPVLIR